jgi:hypothetical protein
MKFRIFIFLFALFSIMTFRIAKAQDQGSVTISNEIFNVPGPGKKLKKENPGQTSQGVERPFTLAKKSKVSLTIASNKQHPTLNVYVLDADNYAKYQDSGSLTNLNSIDSLTKAKTLGFQSDEELAPGKYVLIIRWAERGLFMSAPAVGIKLVAQEIAPKIQKPSTTPTKSFWKKIF